MGDALVAMVYGRALYEAACQRQTEDRVLTELETVAKVLKEEESFCLFLRNPSVEKEKKKEAAGLIFGESICLELMQFLYVLLDKGRIWHLEAIAKQYRRLYEEDRSIAAGTIFSAVPLREEQVEEAGRQVSSLLQKKVSLNSQVDRALIGGVKIQVDGRMIDRSLRGDLERLEKQLQEVEVKS